MIYIKPEDFLVWNVFDPQATGNLLRLSARMLLPDGTLTSINSTQTGLASGLITQKIVPLHEGWLVSAEVTSPSLTARGFIWTTVELNRGSIVGTEALTLIAAYVATGYKTASWPVGRIEVPSEGHGGFNQNLYAAPAAGADFTLTLSPTNQRAMIVGLTATLTTGAAVPVRTVHLVIDDGTNTILEWVAATTQAASTAVRYIAGMYGSEMATRDGVAVIPIPSGIHINGGWRIRSVTTAIAAADAWSAQRLQMEAFFERNA